MERYSFYLFGEGDNDSDPSTSRRLEKTRTQKTRLLTATVACLGFKTFGFETLYNFN